MATTSPSSFAGLLSDELLPPTAAGLEQYVGSKSSIKQRIAHFTYSDRHRSRKPRDA